MEVNTPEDYVSPPENPRPAGVKVFLDQYEFESLLLGTEYDGEEDDDDDEIGEMGGESGMSSPHGTGNSSSAAPFWKQILGGRPISDLTFTDVKESMLSSRVARRDEKAAFRQRVREADRTLKGVFDVFYGKSSEFDLLDTVDSLVFQKGRLDSQRENALRELARQFQHADRSGKILIEDHYAGFNQSIRHFSQIHAELVEANTEVSKISVSLDQALQTLSSAPDDIRDPWLESIEIGEMIRLFRQIEDILSLPSEIEELARTKHYLLAVRKMVFFEERLHNEQMMQLPMLGELRDWATERRRGIFQEIVEEITNVVYSLGKKSFAPGDAKKKGDKVPGVDSRDDGGIGRGSKGSSGIGEIEDLRGFRRTSTSASKLSDDEKHAKMRKAILMAGSFSADGKKMEDDMNLNPPDHDEYFLMLMVRALEELGQLSKAQSQIMQGIRPKLHTLVKRKSEEFARWLQSGGSRRSGGGYPSSSLDGGTSCIGNGNGSAKGSANGKGSGGSGTATGSTTSGIQDTMSASSTSRKRMSGVGASLMGISPAEVNLQHDIAIFLEEFFEMLIQVLRRGIFLIQLFPQKTTIREDKRARTSLTDEQLHQAQKELGEKARELRSERDRPMIFIRALTEYEEWLRNQKTSRLIPGSSITFDSLKLKFETILQSRYEQEVGSGSMEEYQPIMKSIIREFRVVLGQALFPEEGGVVVSSDDMWNDVQRETIQFLGMLVSEDGYGYGEDASGKLTERPNSPNMLQSQSSGLTTGVGGGIGGSRAVSDHRKKLVFSFLEGSDIAGAFSMEKRQKFRGNPLRDLIEPNVYHIIPIFAPTQKFCRRAVSVLRGRDGGAKSSQWRGSMGSAGVVSKELGDLDEWLQSFVDTVFVPHMQNDYQSRIGSILIHREGSGLPLQSSSVPSVVRPSMGSSPLGPQQAYAEGKPLLSDGVTFRGMMAEMVVAAAALPDHRDQIMETFSKTVESFCKQCERRIEEIARRSAAWKYLTDDVMHLFRSHPALQSDGRIDLIREENEKETGELPIEEVKGFTGENYMLVDSAMIEGMDSMQRELRDNVLLDTSRMTLLAGMSNTLEWLRRVLLDIRLSDGKGGFFSIGMHGIGSGMGSVRSYRGEGDGDDDKGSVSDAMTMTSGAGRSWGKFSTRADLSTFIKDSDAIKSRPLCDEHPRLRTLADRMSAQSERCLFILRLDVRVRCLYFLNAIQSSHYSLHDEPTDPETFVVNLNRDLERVEELLSSHLQEHRVQFCFGGLARLISTVLIKSLGRKKMPQFNEYGIRKMERNVFAMQHNLVSIAPYAVIHSCFDKVREYYRLLNMSQADLLDLIQEKGPRFSRSDYISLLQSIRGDLTKTDLESCVRNVFEQWSIEKRAFQRSIH